MRFCFVLTTLLFGLNCHSLLGDEKSAIDSLLTFPLIDAAVPQEQVERFCEAKVARVPVTESTEQWQTAVEQWRKDMFDKVIFRGQARQWRELPTDIVWLDEIQGGPGYRIKKLRYQILPGLWIPALLYEPTELSGKVPVIMNVNGHDSGNGKAAEYKQMRCINQAKRGMIALNVEWLGMGQLHTEGFGHYRMNQLDLCGTSGIAPFYLAMARGLDVLLKHPHADAERVAVAGLSGGGWQTIFISSLDTRVKLTNPVAGYSSFLTRIDHHSDLGDSEQTPCDMAKYADYAHLTAMMAPRATLLTFNVRDNCCFASGHAMQPLVDAAEPAFLLYDQRDRLSTHVNHDPGTHNFLQDNREALYRMLGKHFYPGQTFDANEIASEHEIKSKEELLVPVPADNADFQVLATRLSTDLPRERLPDQPTTAWIDASRERLANIVNAHPYSVTTKELPSIQVGDVTGRLWKLQMDNDWTVPAIEFTRGKDAIEGTTIVVADAGRASTSETVQRLLAEHQRVLAVDPFYLGESTIRSRDFLFALLVGSVGERPVGIQASQLGAVARWTKSRHAGEPVKIVAIGERVSLAAMIASALETTAIDSVRLRQSLGSLKQVIEKNYGINQSPEFFCFGLLEAFDIREIAALTAPRAITFVDADQRVRQELAPLKAWNQSLGNHLDVLP